MSRMFWHFINATAYRQGQIITIFYRAIRNDDQLRGISILFLAKCLLDGMVNLKIFL